MSPPPSIPDHARRGGDRGSVLGRAPYLLRPGRARTLSFAPGRTGAATLTASEIDADKRPRRVVSRVLLVR